MAQITRRGFLWRSAMVAGGGVGVGSAMAALVNRAVLAAPGGQLGRAPAGPGEGGYGPLQPAGPELALPAGFQYRKFSVEGATMSDGHKVPRAHDGMAAFRLPNGNVRLIRNHEDRSTPAQAQLIGDAGKAYDSRGGGGTTSLEVKPDGERELVRDFVSLCGTIVNCAGGPTPWGTWITCEETTAGTAAGWTKPHGYVYEVPVAATGTVPAVPLKALGRFTHEALAVDPRTNVVYETEDQGTAGLYRFLPDHAPRLEAGGKLQMLAIAGKPGYDTRTGQKVGAALPVTWVDIATPDPPAAESQPLTVFNEGHGKGGATFSRLEGIFYGSGKIYVHATDGGDAKLGQVWEYTPVGRDRGVLRLLFESTDPQVLEMPDNLTVSPRGGIVICEDGEQDGNFVRGLTPDGKIFDFANNVLNSREFAGAAFSPDGRTLFVNIQGDGAPGQDGNLGMTFAIWGPWERGAL